MGKMSRAKGARGEREVAAIFRDGGFPEADRGARLGKSGDDVVRVEGLHIEVKYTERLALWESLKQAEKDAPEGMEPVLTFRRNRSGWKAAMDLEFLVGLLRDRRRLQELMDE
jgi:Holliday junction resolvase